ncbi:nuclease-related domain-containing protein [Cognatiyoonia sp. IB215182]|uniref:nuclease-related domain-containing protein n=1 Tax=Cognatiyoonia sp. IB215182 TaxID=3097353 RepID=UPI002A0E29C1|nr:NERD domain-containing protein [Cognatiyoonia sp. IB215182]MDX8355308.1 NERD domain-containing protein [Cognatiyoonia sp. IB215182]
MFNYLLKSAVRSAIRAAERSYNTPERKGGRGERQVHNALSSVLDEDEYRVLSDLILPIASGTTQLDHLILSRFGIFVIETKNMSGWIFGGADQQKWTQVQKGGKRRSFQNPLRQNYAHVKAVQSILDIDLTSLHNFVVFTGTAEPKTKMPENVAWGLRALGKLIAARRQLVFSDFQLNAFAKKLLGRALESNRASRAQHLQNLEKKTAAKTVAHSSGNSNAESQTLCPKCGGEMVQRANRKTGDTFWGCTKFPKCRGTRKVA